MRIITDYLPIYADSTVTERVLPATEPIDTTALKNATFAVFLGSNNVKVRFGVQFSDDGITWGTVNKLDYQPNNAGGAIVYATATGQWNFGDATTDLFGLTGPKLLARFCVVTLMSAGTAVQSATARLRVDLPPLPFARVLRLAPARVNTGTSAGSYVFNAMSEAVETESFNEVRASHGVYGVTANFASRVGYQTSDNPLDPSSWSAPTYLTNDRSTNGIDFGTTFTSFSSTARYVRFGVGAKITSGTDVRCAKSEVRVDLRRV